MGFAASLALLLLLAPVAPARAQAPDGPAAEGDATRLAGEGEGAPASGRTPEELAEILTEADDAWFFGNYLEVIRLLNPLLVPEPDPGLDREQLLSAYELLGASLHFQYGPERSREVFLALLRLDPDYQLDAFVFPESMRDFLEQLRQEHAEELEAIRRERRRGDLSGQLFVGRTIERRSLIVSMIPFGVGHFLNGEKGWGTFYLVSEVLLGGVSMAMYAANEAARGDDGYFRDAGPAQTRQALQIGTGIAFFVVLVANIAHGAAIHQDVIETTYEILDEPPEDFLGPPPSEPETSVWGGPTGDGFVLGVGWTF